MIACLALAAFAEGIVIISQGRVIRALLKRLDHVERRVDHQANLRRLVFREAARIHARQPPPFLN